MARKHPALSMVSTLQVWWLVEAGGTLVWWFHFKDIRAAARATHTRMQCALRSVECWSQCAEKKQFLAIDRQGWSHSISRLDIFTRTSNKTQQHLEFLGQQQNILQSSRVLVIFSTILIRTPHNVSYLTTEYNFLRKEEETSLRFHGHFFTGWIIVLWSNLWSYTCI